MLPYHQSQAFVQPFKLNLPYTGYKNDIIQKKPANSKTLFTMGNSPMQRKKTVKKAVKIPDLGPQFVPLQDVDRFFNPFTLYLNKTIEPFVFDTRGN